MGRHCEGSLICAVEWPAGHLIEQLQPYLIVFPHQEQDLWMSDESQRRGELPARAATVPVGDDVSMVAQLQPLQQVVHYL